MSGTVAGCTGVVTKAPTRREMANILGPEKAASFNAMMGETAPDITLVRGKIVDVSLSLKNMHESLASLGVVFPRLAKDVKTFRLDMLRYNKELLCTSAITDRMMTFNGLYDHVGAVDQRRLLETYKRLKSTDEKVVRHIVATSGALKKKLGDDIVIADDVIMEGPCQWFSFSEVDIKNDLLLLSSEHRLLVATLLKQFVLAGEGVYNAMFTPDITKEEFRDTIMALVQNLKLMFGDKNERGFALLEKQSNFLVDNISGYYGEMMAGSRDGKKDPNIVLSSFVSDVMNSDSREKKDPIAEAQLKNIMMNVENLQKRANKKNGGD